MRVASSISSVFAQSQNRSTLDRSFSTICWRSSPLEDESSDNHVILFSSFLADTNPHSFHCGPHYLNPVNLCSTLLRRSRGQQHRDRIDSFFEISKIFASLIERDTDGYHALNLGKRMMCKILSY